MTVCRTVGGGSTSPRERMGKKEFEKVTCPKCNNDAKLKQFCTLCGKTGKILKPKK